MSVFSSKREKWLWTVVILVLSAIYSTIGLAGELTAYLRERAQLDKVYIFCFILIVSVFIGIALFNKTRIVIILAGLGLLSVYTMIVVRMGLSPEERTHLFEYALVGILIFMALKERRRNNKLKRSPLLIAIVLTLFFGWFDEGLQALIPNRVYDIRDVGFNAIAGLSGILSMSSIQWLKVKIYGGEKRI